jgi:hypothetical protein
MQELSHLAKLVDRTNGGSRIAEAQLKEFISMKEDEQGIVHTPFGAQETENLAARLANLTSMVGELKENADQTIKQQKEAAAIRAAGSGGRDVNRKVEAIQRHINDRVSGNPVSSRIEWGEERVLFRGPQRKIGVDFTALMDPSFTPDDVMRGLDFEPKDIEIDNIAALAARIGSTGLLTATEAIQALGTAMGAPPKKTTPDEALEIIKEHIKSVSADPDTRYAEGGLWITKVTNEISEIIKDDD